MVAENIKQRRDKMLKEFLRPLNPNCTGIVMLHELLLDTYKIPHRFERISDGYFLEYPDKEKLDFVAVSVEQFGDLCEKHLLTVDELDIEDNYKTSVSPYETDIKKVLGRIFAHRKFLMDNI